MQAPGRESSGCGYRGVMEWTADVSSGDWIREGLDVPWGGTIHDVVPRGFRAYARVFHPAFRDRPVGREWPAEGDRAAWEAFHRAPVEVDGERVTWAETASAFGTIMHPLAQWQRLTRFEGPVSVGVAPRDEEGWRYGEPRQGQLDAASWALLAAVLAAHTSTPDDGGVGVWSGWGGLTGGMGYGASRVLFAAEPRPDADPHHDAFLAHAARDVFNSVFTKPTWQPGVLSDEISRGPHLQLPDREFVLFRGGISELAVLDWPERMPWRDPSHVPNGGNQAAESPGVVWPSDRSWVVVSEVDFDSTIVGGDAALLGRLLATPGLEVELLPTDADLRWDADDLNRPASGAR